MGFDVNRAASPGIPTFKFGQVGDGFTGQIVDIADGVETVDPERGTRDKYLVITVQVAAARGGDRAQRGGPTSDTPAGEQRTLWLRYEQDARPSYSPLTRAVALAARNAGAADLQVGGQLRVVHHALAHQPDPRKSPAKLYEATYTPPQAQSIVASTVASTEPPF